MTPMDPFPGHVEPGVLRVDRSIVISMVIGGWDGFEILSPTPMHDIIFLQNSCFGM